MFVRNRFVKPLKNDKCRRKGKGRRCCLGDRNYSIPCRASYLALG